MKIINNTANTFNISKEDYDYLLMIIHLSNIMKDYIVNNVKNGVVDVININDNTSGYINKSIRISR